MQPLSMKMTHTYTYIDKSYVFRPVDKTFCYEDPPAFHIVTYIFALSSRKGYEQLFRFIGKNSKHLILNPIKYALLLTSCINIIQ